MTGKRLVLRAARIVCCLAIAAVAMQIKCVPYMKMNPPPDTDKTWPIPGDNSCWMATAANMLAGAGYGTGTTVQDRAEDVYQDLIAWQTSASNPTGVANGGWADAAVSWWLGSANNTWPANPYKVVTVYGNKSPKYPWNNANGAMTIANELRRCQMVGLSISWPAPGSAIGQGGHAITAWGDDFPSRAALSSNPAAVRLVDSDRDDGGNVSQYAYDAFTNPNPGGDDEGNGWYINYSSSHPYIKHIVTLCPTTNASGTAQVQIVTGSVKVHQKEEAGATDFHYTVYTDVPILSYFTDIDCETDGPPTIVESSNHETLHVTWDLSGKPVPKCQWVTITTELVLPSWNAIKYRDIQFTYPDKKLEVKFPPVGVQVVTPTVGGADTIPNVTGGYLIGRFDLYSPEPRTEPLMQVAFVHQYSYNQSPEQHTVSLAGQRGLVVRNIRFGHSYGLPSAQELWGFEQWMTSDTTPRILGERPLELRVDWRGRLPYPEGENVRDVLKYIQEKPRPKLKQR